VDVSGLLLGVVALLALLVWLGRAVAARVERSAHGTSGATTGYRLDPSVRIDPDLHRRVRDLAAAGDEQRAAAELRAHVPGLGRDDATAIAVAIGSGALPPTDDA